MMFSWILLLVFLIALGRFARSHRRGPDELVATLEAAERTGIISAAQREQILALRSQAAVGASGGVGWLAVFAGLFVVAGVAMLIASNWERFGPPERIVGFLALLAAVGEGAIRSREREAAIGLPLELLWFFLPLLGIGLYVQTFQLSGGDPFVPLLTWLALSAPIAWSSPRATVPIVHAGAMVAVLFTGNFLSGLGEWFLPGGSRGLLSLLDRGTFTAWAMTALLLAAIVAEGARLLPRPHRLHFVGVLPAWVMALLLAPTLFQVAHPGWLALAAIALVTVWLTTLGALGAESEESSPATVAWLAVVWGLSFSWHFTDTFVGDAKAAGVVLTLLTAAAAAAGAVTSPNPGLGSRPGHAARSRMLMLAALGVEALYVVPLPGFPFLLGVANNVLLAFAATGLMWQGARHGDAILVNLGVGALLVLLVTRFLDVFGGLFASGVGLILAGMLLAGLSLALERTRRRLLRDAAGVTP